MQRGDTVLMYLGRSSKPHLWVVVTEPQNPGNRAVVVSVTTLRHQKDQTVILRKGDHPFIRHDSIISYSDALIIDVAKLEEEIESGRA